MNFCSMNLSVLKLSLKFIELINVELLLIIKNALYQMPFENTHLSTNKSESGMTI